MRLLLGLVQLPVKLSVDLAGRALSVVTRAVAQSPTAPPRPAPPPPRAAPPRRNGGAPPVPRPRPPFTDEPQPEPPHVSEGPELVAEVAEQGAEGGAGAEVHVDPPWEGYEELTAADVKRRLEAEDVSVAAAVTLYEASHKGRSSVLEAAARRTRSSARPSG